MTININNEDALTFNFSAFGKCAEWLFSDNVRNDSSLIFSYKLLCNAIVSLHNDLMMCKYDCKCLSCVLMFIVSSSCRYKEKFFGTISQSLSYIVNIDFFFILPSFQFSFRLLQSFSYSLCVLGIHNFVSIKLVQLFFLYKTSYYKLMVWWKNTSCLAKRKGVKVRTHITGLSYWMRRTKRGSDLDSGVWVREYELWCLCIDEFSELLR